MAYLIVYILFLCRGAPVVCRRVHVSFTLFLYVYVKWCPTHCVMLLFSLSSSCVSYVASFSGLFIFIAPSVFSSVYLLPISQNSKNILLLKFFLKKPQKTPIFNIIQYFTFFINTFHAMLTLLFPERPIYDSFIPFMKNDRTSSFIWKIKVPVKLTTVKIVNYFSAMTWRE